MNFLATFQTLLMKNKLSMQRYYYGLKERPHISKSKIDAYASAINMLPNQVWSLDYNLLVGIRYMYARDITYSLFVCVYDVNTMRMCSANLYKPSASIVNSFELNVKRLASKNPNLEGRLFGMQDGQKVTIVEDILAIFARYNVHLAEIDIFGNQIRHITIDAHTGASFNVLLEDRIYRPGELNNSTSIEKFEYENKDILHYVSDVLS